MGFFLKVNSSRKNLISVVARGAALLGGRDDIYTGFHRTRGHRLHYRYDRPEITLRSPSFVVGIKASCRLIW